MKTINLLPKSQKKELELEFVSHQIVVFWSLIVFTLALFIGTAWVFQFYIGQVITDNDRLIAESKKQLESSEYKELNTQIISLNGAVAEIKNLKANHYNWSQVMLKVSDLVNPTVQMNQITFDAATGEVEVIGQAKTRQDVIDFWSNVVKSSYFSKINFPLNNLERPTKSNFTFKFFVVKDKFANPK